MCHAHTQHYIHHMLTCPLHINPLHVSFLPQRYECSTNHSRSCPCALTTIFLKVPASFWGNFWFPPDMMASPLRPRAFPVPRSASAELFSPRQPLDAATPPAQASAICTSTWGRLQGSSRDLQNLRYSSAFRALCASTERGCVW